MISWRAQLLQLLILEVLWGAPAVLTPAQKGNAELEHKGYTLMREERWEEALSIWKNLLSGEPRSLPAAYSLARCYFETGLHREAIAVLEQLHAIGVSDGASLNLLGKLLHQVGASDSALSQLKSAAKTDPRREDYQTDLATVLIELSRYTQAREFLREALAQIPDSVRLGYQLAVVEGELGNIQGALESYRRVMNLVPGFEPAYIEMGNLLVRHGRPGEAIDLLQPAMSRGMKNPVIGCLYCKALLLAYPDQRLPELESRLETAIGADPKWEVPRLLLAEYHLNLKQSSQALHQLEKILALQPHNGEALYLTGKALKDLGRTTEAADRLAGAVKQLEHEKTGVKNRAAASYKLGLVYLEVGDVALATQQLQAAADLNPENPLFRLALAQAFTRAFNHEDALKQYQLARESAPSSYPVLYQYGREMSRQVRHHDAVHYFEKALAIKPNYDLLIDIARELFSMDRRKRGADFLEQAIAMAPDRAEAYYYLALPAHSWGRYEEAAALFGKAIERDPRHREALLALGEVEFHLGRLETAESHLMRALRLNAGDVAALYWMGRIKHRTGSRSEAVDLWQQALKTDPGHIASHHQLAQHYLETGNRAQADYHLSQLVRLRSEQARQALSSNPDKVYR